MLKVLYDITVLGKGHLNHRARTGIFRVVENIAIELVKIPGLDIEFCSSESINELIACQDYLKSKDEFTRIKFNVPKKAKWILFFCKYVDQYKSKSNLYNRLGFYKMTVDFLRYRFIWAFQKLFLRNGIYLESDHHSFDIYHSPFLPLPANLKKQHFKNSFITIYDMLPVLYPDYFEIGTIAAMEKVYDSITDETWVTCISNTTKKELLEYKSGSINQNNVFVTPLAASNYFYKSNDKAWNAECLLKYNIPSRPYVLSLCTIEPRKNIVQSINAFVKMVEDYHIEDFYFVLVGTKGWDFDSIFDRLDSCTLSRSRFIITGFVPDEHLAAIYSEAMMFVYPSLYEGFGLPPLEAMQCGVPVITSNTSSLPEVVGDAAIMIDPTNSIELEHAMYSIYADEALRRHFSEKGLEQARKFSWKKCAEQTMDVYRKSMHS
jgi:glycosyltransferase involved in cell wall biosynthesis